MTSPGAPIDFAFLDAQTFGDADLAQEVLALFVAQARRLVPALPDLDVERQSENAHLLKGSCQGIGAVAAADLLQAYGLADAPGRAALQPELAAAFAAIEAAIAARSGAT